MAARQITRLARRATQRQSFYYWVGFADHLADGALLGAEAERIADAGAGVHLIIHAAAWISSSSEISCMVVV